MPVNFVTAREIVRNMSRLNYQFGFSLLEVAIAMVLASCCILPLLARQTTWLKSSKSAGQSVSDFFELFDSKSPQITRICSTLELPGGLNEIRCQASGALADKAVEYSILVN